VGFASLKPTYKMPKKPISATIDEELITWIDKKLKDKQRFRNKSHLIEIALESLKHQDSTNL